MCSGAVISIYRMHRKSAEYSLLARFPWVTVTIVCTLLITTSHLIKGSIQSLCASYLSKLFNILEQLSLLKKYVVSNGSSNVSHSFKSLNSYKVYCWTVVQLQAVLLWIFGWTRIVYLREVLELQVHDGVIGVVVAGAAAWRLRA